MLANEDEEVPLDGVDVIHAVARRGTRYASLTISQKRYGGASTWQT